MFFWNKAVLWFTVVRWMTDRLTLHKLFHIELLMVAYLEHCINWILQCAQKYKLWYYWWQTYTLSHHFHDLRCPNAECQCGKPVGRRWHNLQADSLEFFNFDHHARGCAAQYLKIINTPNNVPSTSGTNRISLVEEFAHSTGTLCIVSTH